MRLTWSRWCAAGSLGVALVAGATALAATRPHYGGTLRVEMREAYDKPEAMAPPAGVVLASWEAGRRALNTADGLIWTLSRFKWADRCATNPPISNWGRRT